LPVLARFGARQTPSMGSAQSCNDCSLSKEPAMENPETESAPATAEPRNSFLEEKAFKSRTVLVFGAISDSSASEVARRLIALDADSSAPIDMLVSSPGGHLESGDAIHDILRFISAPVNMIGTGWVGSAATHLYLAVPRDRRYCTPNTRFLIHQPSGGAGGQASDIAIHAKEILKARERIARTISRETGKPLDAVLVDIERDRWLSAEEAVEYGLVGRVIERKTDLKR
jgi:ATP-dependent Clp protease protease subunit